eukprot:TRINITY_DN7011_c0_g1_i2.p1 TRINITY_DN7011_c0_g1~~TRINITY_DN7011_c0_g1_i2.p1  ORF type:complete len:302 (+),score=74.47 TRINITY_DN7011_c0_g1_i2:79-906(+)
MSPPMPPQRALRRACAAAARRGRPAAAISQRRGVSAFADIAPGDRTNMADAASRTPRIPDEASPAEAPSGNPGLGQSVATDDRNALLRGSRAATARTLTGEHTLMWDRAVGRGFGFNQPTFAAQDLAERVDRGPDPGMKKLNQWMSAQGVWTCARCKTVNPSTTGRCSGCRERKAARYWVCSSCLAPSPWRQGTCANCRGPGSMRLAGSARRGDWVCKKCKVICGGDPVCPSCSSPACPATEHRPFDPKGSWPCSRCGSRNFKTNKKCSACGFWK